MRTQDQWMSGPGRILIVEDEALMCEELSILLMKDGYDVVAAASSGLEALAKAEETNPDLVLMDIRLKGEIDGIEVARRIKEKMDCAIVYLTAYSEDSDLAERAKMTQPGAFLSKGVSPLELKHTVEMALYKQKMEKRLKQSEEKYRNLVEMAPNGIVEIDFLGRITFLNPGYCRIVGYSAEELMGKSILDLNKSSEERQRLSDYLANLVREEPVPTPWLGKSRTKDGELIDVQADWNYKRDDRGNVIGFVAIVTDITDRKKAEEALREREEVYAALVETTDTGYVIIDHEGRVLDANSEYVRLTGHNGIQEILGRSVVEWTAEHDRERNAHEVKKCFQKGFVRNLEIDYVGRRGNIVPIEINATVASLKSGVHIVTLCRDITDRKKAENQLKASLKEKELLVREIHHRVKNNLAMMASLLNLQSEYAEGKATGEVFQESRDRIRSMALAHDMLYQSESLAEIDLPDYVAKLVAYLRQTVGTIGTSLKLESNVEDVALSPNTIIPLGLILNELVSNCLKHAFRDRDWGEIGISLRSINKGEYELIVKDNGCGIPQNVDVKEGGLFGLRLVSLLVKQLHGDLQIRGDAGSEVRIRFREI